ncbi:MAG: HlyC/CorC family transporter [Eggerthellaceae bacterium]|nr:HlyC/CorC family transporter [Eggerthellaceae bacterium]
MLMSKESREGDSPKPGFFDGLMDAFGRGRRQVSEDEIKELVDDADELLEDEKRMIGEILDLDELTVSDVMQPRVDIMAVEDGETIRAALERMRGTGYSRLPVYHESLDHIVGIVHYKDLIPAVLDGEVEGLVTDYMHDALYVPETKDLFPLLSEMQTNRQQMAIVVDEYGGTDGLITLEDIVEEIVGDIIDETDSETAYVTEAGSGEWRVDGRCPVETARELGWPVEESDQYETIAGWLLDTADAVPQVGDELVVDGYRFKVLKMRRRRIRNLHVARLESAE